MARRYRPRKLFKFWLYRDLIEDTRLIEYIDYLHKTRQFATMVRSGLRLMWTLGEGDLSVLFELFPGLQSRLQPNNDELIAQFRQMLQAQSIVVQAPSIPPALTTGAAIAAPPLIAPTFDDGDTIVIRRDATAGSAAAANFLDSVFGLQ
jgi:hypothetical protein